MAAKKQNTPVLLKREVEEGFDWMPLYMQWLNCSGRGVILKLLIIVTDSLKPESERIQLKIVDFEYIK